MLCDQLARGDLPRRTRSHEPAARDEREPVAVLGRERQLVHRRDDGQPPVEPELGDELEHLLLAAEVERGGRLVEQEQRRLLRERPREDSPLLLAAAQRAQRPARELDELEAPERAVGGLVVAAPLGRERADVRRASEQDVVADAHLGRQHRRLRHERDPAREVAPSQRPGVALVEADRPLERHELCDRAQQRALAGSVRSDQRQPLALLDGERDVLHDRHPPE